MVKTVISIWGLNRQNQNTTSASGPCSQSGCCKLQLWLLQIISASSARLQLHNTDLIDLKTGISAPARLLLIIFTSFQLQPIIYIFPSVKFNFEIINMYIR